MSNRPWINYHHLLYFKTIAMEGSIAKAAKKLRLGQPTLSTQLKQFETVLGHDLFDRVGRNLTLTERGRLVLNYATEIFRIGDEMVDSLSDQTSSTQVKIQIGAMDSVPKHLMYKIYAFCRKYRDCSVTIREGDGLQLLSDLKSHRLDLVVANYPPPVNHSEGLYSKKINNMDVIVCGHPKFQGLRKEFPTSLNHQPFGVPTVESKLRYDLDTFFRLQNITPRIIAEIQDTSLLKIVALHGDALVVMPATAVDEFIKSKELISIGSLHDLDEELWFVAANRKMDNPIAANLFRHFSIA